MSAPLDHLLTVLREHGHEPREAGDGWTCRCPAHDDRNPSLSINVGDDGRVLLRCHRGCPTEEIVGSVGLTLADLFVPDPTRQNGRHKAKARSTTAAKPSKPTTPIRTWEKAHEVVTWLEGKRGPRAAAWTYTDPTDKPVSVTVRWDIPADPNDPESEPFKDIQPVSLMPDGRWANKAMPTPRYLYRLSGILGAPADTRIYVLEGEKCVDVARACGLVATTSPNGAQSAAKADWSVMAGRHVVIVPDRDKAGADYAAAAAQLCRDAGAASVRVVRLWERWPDLPEKGGDLADLATGKDADGLASLGREVEALADKAEQVEMPAAKLTPPNSDADDDDHRPSQAEQLARLATDLYVFGRTPKNEPFAVLKGGPNVALRMSGSGGAMRDTLAREYRKAHGRIASATAHADALAALRGEAIDAEPSPTYLRVGPFNEGIVLDLGTKSGEAVVVDGAGWRVVERSPILLQRTALTGELPLPTRGWSINSLRDLLNVTDETWPILLGWMVAALIPEMPHPILMLGGGQGTGKTTAARYICGIFDPSDAPTRSQPRDPEAWAMSVANGWTTVIDNVSTIPEWWSDALCKAVTGDGWVRRTLYSDGEVSVLSFRRVIALTSIDAGALRGDLGERLVLVDLEPITRGRRRTERDLNRAYSAAKSALLGALLDIVAGVLARLDTINVPDLPRMADFARVLAAMDATIGTDALARYSGQGKRIAGEVVDADPVGAAVVAFVTARGSWQGTAGALLTAVQPSPPDRAWPKNARGMGARLKRLAPALEAMGVRVFPPDPADKTRRYVLQPTAQTAQPPKTGPAAADGAVLARAIVQTEVPEDCAIAHDRPTIERGSEAVGADSGLMGGMGGSSQPSTLADADGWEEVPE